MANQDQLSLLDSIDWDFKDYSIASSPNDLNYLHWYPAPFIPQIPSIFIQLFSNKGDTVLDPFCGSGVTLVEAAKQNRKFIGVDSNPFSIEISKSKFRAIKYANDDWLQDIESEVESGKHITDIENYCILNKINVEVKKWFEKDTLIELLGIHKILSHRSNENTYLLEKILFSSTLYKVCSQRDHYTYITDRCFPKNLIKYSAQDIFLQHAKIINGASKLFRSQYKALNNVSSITLEGEIKQANSQSLNWIKNDSVDLIVTSPPYLGVHEYNKSMRLINYFYNNYEFKKLVEEEIGSRSKRKRKNAFENYIKEIKLCLNEFKRIVKNNGYLAIVIGQGTGKVVKSDVIEIVNNHLCETLGFKLLYKKSRRVMFRRIQTPGTSKEYIELFKKN